MKILVILSFAILTLIPARISDEVPDDMKGMLKTHNQWRAKKGLPPLVWSNQLAAYAQEWCQVLASQGCNMRHRPRTGRYAQQYGENIFWSSGISYQPAEVTDYWCREHKYYNESSGKCVGGECGHYTQVMWRNTKRLGCAKVRCGNEEIWVCNYDPPGNYVSQKAY